MIKTCKICHLKFQTADKRRKYCSVKCYHVKASRVPNKGTFQQKQDPWNKNLKGIHLSPKTQFKKGQPSINHLEVGTITVRTEKKKNRRAWIKTAEPNEWQMYAVYVWEQINGKLPKNKVVHHIDRNSLNDDPINLIALTRAEHLDEHRSEFARRIKKSG